MPAPPVVSTLPGATFDCHGCGECCRSFDFGPVDDAVIENLLRLDAGSLVPGLAGGPFHETRQREDGPAHYFLRSGDACIFLDDAGRCRIHAAHGPQAKPWFCRAFPFAPVAGPEGLRLGWRPECAGRHKAAPNPTPLAAHGPEVIADAEHYPFRAVFPKGTRLPGGVVPPHATYPAIERALLAQAAEVRQSFDAVFPALRTAMRAVEGALGGEGLVETGEGASAWTEPLQALANAHRAAAAELQAVQPDTVQAWAASNVTRILASEPRPAELDAAAANFLREELTNHIFTGATTVHDGLAAGFGTFLFAALAVRGAAADRGGEPIGVEALNHDWARWHRGTGWRDPLGDLEDLQGAFAKMFLAFDP